MKFYSLSVNPVGKPRMTVRDKWKHRPVVDHYYSFKDEIVLKANLLGLHSLPDNIFGIIFIIPMPSSWSAKKKKLFDGQPHRQKPDLDNLLKSLQDCLCKEDKHIWNIGNMRKIWGMTGSIEISLYD